MQYNSVSYLYDFIIGPNKWEIIQEGSERKVQSMNETWWKVKYKAGSMKWEKKRNDVTYPNNHTMCWQIYTPGQGWSTDQYFD
jgi:hypothetical protein